MGFLRLWQNPDLMGLNRPRIRIQRPQKHKVNMVRPPDQNKNFFFVWLCNKITLDKGQDDKIRKIREDFINMMLRNNDVPPQVT